MMEVYETGEDADGDEWRVCRLGDQVRVDYRGPGGEWLLFGRLDMPKGVFE